MRGHDDTVATLIQQGAKLDTQDNVGDTALHLAAAANHDGTVRVLLGSGADTTIQNKDGKTAWDVAHPRVRLQLRPLPSP